MRYKVKDIDLCYPADRNCATIKINTLNGILNSKLNVIFFPSLTKLIPKLGAEMISAIAFTISAIQFKISAIASAISAIAFKNSAIASVISAVAEKDSAIASASSAIAFKDSAIQFINSAIAFNKSAIAYTPYSFTILPDTASFLLPKAAFITRSNHIDLRYKGSYCFSDWFRKKSRNVVTPYRAVRMNPGVS